MRWLTIIILRLRTLLQRSQVERELQDEIQFHLDEQAAEYRAVGMAPDEARASARREIGGITQVREECRDARGVNFLETTFLDLRYAVRSLCQNPGFTAVVVVSLALGIGANTAVFSVVNAILLRPLPYEDPERIVVINQVHTTGYGRYALAADYRAWEKENPVFEQMAYWYDANMTIVNGGVAQPIEGQGVSVHLFPVLGVEPILGRNFLPEDEKISAAPTVILIHRLWERLLENDPNVIGMNLRINREHATVVGVMPPGFSFANEKAQIWAATRPDSRRPSRYRPVTARLKPGVSIEQAQVAMETIAARRAEEFPETNGDWGIRL